MPAPQMNYLDLLVSLLLFTDNLIRVNKGVKYYFLYICSSGLFNNCEKELLKIYFSPTF